MARVTPRVFKCTPANAGGDAATGALPVLEASMHTTLRCRVYRDGRTCCAWGIKNGQVLPAVLVHTMECQGMGMHILSRQGDRETRRQGSMRTHTFPALCCSHLNNACHRCAALLCACMQGLELSSPLHHGPKTIDPSAFSSPSEVDMSTSHPQKWVVGEDESRNANENKRRAVNQEQKPRDEGGKQEGNKGVTFGGWRMRTLEGTSRLALKSRIDQLLVHNWLIRPWVEKPVEQNRNGWEHSLHAVSPLPDTHGEFSLLQNKAALRRKAKKGKVTYSSVFLGSTVTPIPVKR
ncbi:hypothetical protein BC826DRAFT_972588 [Russula brevipes]|nr:hypothetical protein BC826DRAFT_972588 [Russula brevipes]